MQNNAILKGNVFAKQDSLTIITDEGFTIHPDKTRAMRKNGRQEVTGIVVNEKLSIDRKTLKRFRALLFQIEKDGPTDKKWGAGALIPSIEGCKITNPKNWQSTEDLSNGPKVTVIGKS